MSHAWFHSFSSLIRISLLDPKHDSRHLHNPYLALDDAGRGMLGLERLMDIVSQMRTLRGSEIEISLTQVIQLDGQSWHGTDAQPGLFYPSRSALRQCEVQFPLPCLLPQCGVLPHLFDSDNGDGLVVAVMIITQFDFFGSRHFIYT